jgi:hypothetical protein
MNWFLLPTETLVPVVDLLLLGCRWGLVNAAEIYVNGTDHVYSKHHEKFKGLSPEKIILFLGMCLFLGFST